MSALVRYLPLVLLAAGWELAARSGLVSQLALPPLSQVVLAWVEMIRSGELVTTKHSHEDPYFAVNEAFEAITRQLEEALEIQRGEVKRHAGTRGGNALL